MAIESFSESGLKKASIEDLREAATNPLSIPAPGTFGEGQIVNTRFLLRELKNRVQAGELKLDEFIDVTQPAVTRAAELTGILGAGGQAGLGLSLFGQILNEGFATNTGAGFDVRLPFSTREFQQLPEDVLPSVEDVDKGLFPVEALPSGGIERLQRVADTRLAAERETQLEQQRQQQQGLEQQVTAQPLLPEQQEQFVRDPQRPGEFIPIPIVGDVTRPVVPQTPDQRLIETEARRQEEQQRRAFEASRALRERTLQETGELLTTQRGQAFERFVPEAAEQLQTKGLLQTSELENVLGREQSQLQQESEALLGQARLAGGQQEIEDISELLPQCVAKGWLRQFHLD